MSDSSRTPASSLVTRAAAAGVAPLMLGGSMWAVRYDLREQLARVGSDPAYAGLAMRAATTAEPAQPVGGNVAVIPLTGIITPQGSIFDFLFGGSGGLLGFRAALAEAVASPDVSSIVIDVDSPGGLVDMVPETAAFIRAARDVGKRIVAVVDTKMCSAAYWLGAQADEIVMTPSGHAGSVGVYRVHEDRSRANADLGLAVTYVHAGEFKVEGNPNGPLDQAARDQWQAEVEHTYEAFVADVALARGIDEQKVLDDFGQGRVLNADDALAAGMVDRIGTFDEVVHGLIGATASGSRQVASAVPAVSVGSLPPGSPVFAACHSADQRCETQAECLVNGSCTCAAAPEPESAAMNDEERQMIAALLFA